MKNMANLLEKIDIYCGITMEALNDHHHLPGRDAQRRNNGRRFPVKWMVWLGANHQ